MFAVCLQNFNQFSEFFHCWKANEISNKTAVVLPPHTMHVAALPWEVTKNELAADHQEHGN